MGHAGHDHGVDIATTTAAGGSCPNSPPIIQHPIAELHKLSRLFCVGESLIALCAAMPSLPSCALYEACKVNSTAIPNTSTTCLPTSLIANFCTSCRMLPAYIRMCKDMPNMSQCDGMDEMCTNGLCDAIIAADSKSSTASASTTSSTSSSSGGHNHGGSDGMLMAFHNNIQTPLLLAEWTRKLPWQSLPVRLEHRFASSYTGLSRRGSDATAIDQSETLVTRASRGASRFGLRIVGAALSYLLMLIVMTFNLGLFFAVLMGLAIGTRPTGTSKHMPDDCC
ncbi:hypothetical protein BC829DRAFT_395803 [Chytridium lagenaria]|nr:hypothetical protein BC829DRAFT_395803 [Chytridium lagenaria]